MYKFLIMLCVCGLGIHCAYADYYRASGGGVYELYVSDCSDTGMRRALDNAVASKKAVITKVICAADIKTEGTAVATFDYDLDSLPIVDLCPCSTTVMCDC